MSTVRTLGTIGGVIAAMALGRVVTEHVPIDGAADEPFVRAGVVGKKVVSEYAAITVDAVRAADFVVGVDPVKASGVFVVVDVSARGRGAEDRVSFLRLAAAGGGTFGVTARGASCARSLPTYPGLTTYARLCFDVPVKELEGLHLELGRASPAVANGNARDEVIDIDLGIDAARADQLATEPLTLEGSVDAMEKPNPTPLPAPTPEAEEGS